MASLREQQRAFAAALRDPQAACPVAPSRNLSIYRNNSAIAFRGALERSFPAILRRVGVDYFRQLCAHYRERFPSRSGDLHFAGQHFAEFLAGHLADDYAWLADLARIEWAREQASVAAELPPLPVSALAGHDGESLERLVFGLQPSLHLVASPFPVFTVWERNHSGNVTPVDQSMGGEVGLIRIRSDTPQIRRLELPVFTFLTSLREGTTLGEAVSRAALDESGLAQALRFAFGEELVVSAGRAAGD